VLGPVKQPAPLPKLSRTPGQIYRTAPGVGEHNAEFYGGLLGLSDEEMACLKEDGII
jgi:crotonobetainyl-CoA:carnitine CoA-transferase CaiB-like acyl-CoA transferase